MKSLIQLTHKVTISIVIMIIAGFVQAEPTLERTLSLISNSDNKGVGLVDISPNGENVALGGGQVITVYNMNSGTLVSNFSDESTGIFNGRFFPNSEKFLTANVAGEVNVWDIHTGSSLLRFKLNFDKSGAEFARYLTVGIVVSPDQETIITSNEMGEIRIWDAEDGSLLDDLRNPVAPGPAFTIEFLPNGHLLFGGPGGSGIWDMENKRVVEKIPYNFATLSGNKGRIVGTRNMEIALIITSNFVVEKVHENLTDIDPLTISLSNDGTRMIYETPEEERVEIRSTITGTLLGEISQEKGIGPMEFTPDGKRIVVGGEGGANVYDISNLTSGIDNPQEN